LKDTIARAPQIRAIEIKLSQGAKPGVGGLLPRAKITAEIAGIRGIPLDRDCVSPAAHSAFRNADEMLDFVESIAGETGLPVGIKSAVGDSAFWKELARLMVNGSRGVDFITIDGGEGGTGAGPLVFTDHVALPFKVAFSRVQEDLHGTGSARAGRLHRIRQAGLSRSDAVCVCAWLRLHQRGSRGHDGDRLHPGAALSHELLPDGCRHAPPVARARRGSHEQGGTAGQLHRGAAKRHACAEPRVRRAASGADQLELLDDRFGATTVAELFGYGRGFGLPSPTDCDEVRRIMNG
jgi:hypothetical protein